MAPSETLEKHQGEVNQPEPADQDHRPSGTMFDPETIRKFLEKIKKEDQ